MSEQINNQTSNQDEVVHRQLIYTDEFKQLISEHPGIIASFMRLEKTIRSVRSEGELKFDDVFEDDEIKITIIGKKVANGSSVSSDESIYYKVEFGDNKIFVKSVPGYFNHGLGYNEFIGIQKAIELLRGIKGVTVVDFKLGYQDTSGTTYFVSRWENHLMLLDYYRQLSSYDRQEKETIINKRLDQISTILEEHYYDFAYNNILYDPVEDKIIIFDIYEKKAIREERGF
jgi:hypothetical protein